MRRTKRSPGQWKVDAQSLTEELESLRADTTATQDETTKIRDAANQALALVSKLEQEVAIQQEEEAFHGGPDVDVEELQATACVLDCDGSFKG